MAHIADQVDNALLHRGQRPHGVDRIRQTFQAVADGDADVGDAAVLHLRQHAEPELGAFTAVASLLDAQDVPLTVDGDADDHIHRLVPDLTIADLHHDRVDEDHRIDPVHGRLNHSVISSTTLSVILEIVSLEIDAPYTSAKCAEISPVVKPLAVSDNTI